MKGYLMADRIKSGIQGLDELIEGGFPKDFCYALVGGPGAGKTIFGAQFLYNGATQYNENGLYITLEEPPYSIANNMMRFGWNFYELEKRGKLAMINATPIKEPGQREYTIEGEFGVEEFNVDGFLGVIAEAKRKIDAKRCVIDSLTALALKYRDEFEARQQILKLIKGLTEMKLTTILLNEKAEESMDHQKFSAAEFLAQGIIYLHTYHIRDFTVRALEVRKMRGTNTVNKLCLYTFTESGIVVYPQETIFRQNL